MTDQQIEELARQLYENEPPKPQQPWLNLSDTTRGHYRRYAHNLLAARPSVLGG